MSSILFVGNDSNELLNTTRIAVIFSKCLMFDFFADLEVQFGAQIIGLRMQTVKTGPCNRIGT